MLPRRKDEADGLGEVSPRLASHYESTLQRFLGQGPRGLAEYDGKIARKRLQEREAESFIPRGKEKEVGGRVYTGHGVVGDAAQGPNVPDLAGVTAGD